MAAVEKTKVHQGKLYCRRCKERTRHEFVVKDGWRVVGARCRKCGEEW